MWQAGALQLSLSPDSGGSLIRGVMAMAQTGLAQSVGAGQEPSEPLHQNAVLQVRLQMRQPSGWPMVDPIEIQL